MSKISGLGAALAGAIGENAERQGVTHWLDTGLPSLNKAISGRFEDGVPAGRIVEIFGPSSSGKTAIATRIMISAQLQGGVAAFFDHENSFEHEIANQFGLDTDDSDIWSYQVPDTFEDSMDKAKNFMRIVREFHGPGVPCVIVFDSLASMVPMSAMVDSKGKEKDATTRNMNDNTALARATSAHFPALAKLASKHNVSLIFLNQMRTKIGVMYGDPTTTPGGDSPKYYSSVRIKLGAKIITKGEGAKKQKVGQEVGAECIKNKVSYPFKKTSWNFMFGEVGFDVEQAIADDLVSLGILEVSGAYVVIDGKKMFKSQAGKYIRDNNKKEEMIAMLLEWEKDNPDSTI